MSEGPAGYGKADAHLATAEGAGALVKVGSYIGEMEDGLPHGHGRLSMRNGSVWWGVHAAGRAHGYGVLEYEDGSLYKGQAISSGERVMRDGMGRLADATRLVARAKEGIWFHDDLVNNDPLRADFACRANDANNRAVRAADAVCEHEMPRPQPPVGPTADDTRSHERFLAHFHAHSERLTQLARLRRLLPADHPSQAPGGVIEQLEAALAAQRTDPSPLALQKPRARFLHCVIKDLVKNRDAVRQAEDLQPRKRGADVQRKAEVMRLQEMWVRDQAVGADLYIVAWRTLAKERKQQAVAAGTYESGGWHWDVSADDIIMLMKKATYFPQWTEPPLASRPSAPAPSSTLYYLLDSIA